MRRDLDKIADIVRQVKIDGVQWAFGYYEFVDPAEVASVSWKYDGVSLVEQTVNSGATFQDTVSFVVSIPTTVKGFEFTLYEMVSRLAKIVGKQRFVVINVSGYEINETKMECMVTTTHLG